MCVFVSPECISCASSVEVICFFRVWIDTSPDEVRDVSVHF